MKWLLKLFGYREPPSWLIARTKDGTVSPVMISGKGAVVKNPHYLATIADDEKWQEHIRKAKESRDGVR